MKFLEIPSPGIHCQTQVLPTYPFCIRLHPFSRGLHQGLDTPWEEADHATDTHPPLHLSMPGVQQRLDSSREEA